MTIPPKPRIPGSQVAPNQRPLYRDAPTASTHSKLPIGQATAGRLFRVRCKDWQAVHGENLTWDEANRLKDQVASQGYRTARVEDMEVDPPDWYEASATPTQSVDSEDPRLEEMRAPAVHAAASAAEAANERVAARARAATLAAMTGARPVVIPLPEAAPVQLPPPTSKQSKFVAPVVAPKPKSPPGAPRQVYRDKTVRPLVVRTEPPPRDRTASTEILKRASAPPSAPPRPFISPLKAAMMADDPLEVPDNVAVVVDDDLSDLTADLGGGPDEGDVAQAKAQRDAERQARGR